MAPDDDKQDPPARIRREMVDDETPLRIRQDERTPPAGHKEGSVEVPEGEWAEHNRRSDTADRLARGRRPIE